MQNTNRERQQNMRSYPLEARFAFRKHMIINREFESMLRESGLDNFDALMRFKGGETVKESIKERSTVRFNVPEGNNKTLMYLKRYQHATITSFLKHCFSFSKTYSAIHEWRSILAFKAADLPTMTPIAVGLRRKTLFGKESFLLTQSIPRVMTLEKKLQEDFIPPLSKTQREQKQTLIERLAILTRKMHEAGFKHQDFYLCHILMDWSNPGDPLLYIADLHRVRRQRKSTRRWRVKDLASLNYSASPKIVSRTDRLRFLSAYDPILAKDKSFVMAITEKTRRIRNHTEKKRGL